MENNEQNKVEGVNTQQPAKKSGLYTAGLICSIVGLCLFFSVWIGLICGVLGIVFGAIAYNKGSQNKTPIILGAVATVLAIVMIIVYSVIGGIFVKNTKNKVEGLFNETFEKFENTVENMPKDFFDDEYELDEDKENIDEETSDKDNNFDTEMDELEKRAQDVFNNARQKINDAFNQ